MDLIEQISFYDIISIFHIPNIYLTELNQMEFQMKNTKTYGNLMTIFFCFKPS